ncbi:HlyD family efflux transporter periplasmic adaptor subunit [Lewinella sp. W8]|uniref:HlyD family efflux transporter periplasmic adaptor subunit n=1 Tax=Lewinella sp. W8 TaxID=2528208 RepID=UPI0010682405|nr:HlyD family efflux transporter periplasmic adaptor subunit [Lewinella sp. W8]MTB53812.1 HlyD family efflux transporter periplasmic adaptor subunit [Lewinella sp. W8]
MADYASSSTPAQSPQLRRSQDVEEVIGTPPVWLAKYGTLVLLVFVVSLATLASFYSYPDVVEGELTLTTIDPPRRLQVKQDFSIDRILVNSGDTVEAAQTLMVAKTRGTYEHLSSLDTRLYNMRDQTDQALAELEIPANWNLGEIQEAVYDFQEKQEVYNNLVARRLDGLTTPELRRRIAERERYIREQRQLQERLERQLQGERERLTREEQLLRDGIDNQEQLNTARRSVEITEADLQRSRSNVRAASFDIELMRNQIESYRGGLPSTVAKAADDLRNSFSALRASLGEWMRDYTVVSPVRGQVLFDRLIQKDRFLLQASEVATVIPATNSDIIGRIDLALKGSGKVEVGQRVMVQFDNYPYLEFGSVQGVVMNKGTIPTDRKITVEVAFPKGLKTTIGRRLEPSPLMHGQANIITDDETLLRRFLGR